ncbi:ABC transporter substrate-binding protein [Pollutimonas subterranea]|uniref:ABC transporter substrate-binding protein n=1 Tax=Pollutimonas subterranea TaxID=2045210 RepID=A0A2N4U4X9_9BURK|nr:ABC transporter substrate-binding protein [Pollutimonas subterranea]
MLFSSVAWGQTTLRIGLQDDPDQLDPARARTFVGRIVFASLCDKLVDITPELEFVPQLATQWSWPDNKTLKFTLRENAVYHDGTPIDAASVKANLERAKNLPDSNRKSELVTLASVDAPDARTVVLHLTQPDASLLSQLSDRAGMMQSPASFNKDPGKNPVCSGPYRFKSRVQNDHITLEKFAQHWDAANYHFQTVVFRPVPDATVRLNNMRSGGLDIAERLAPADAQTVKDDPNLSFMPVTGLGFQAISVNFANAPRADNPFAKDARVRQAFDLSIDRDAINQVVGMGLYQPAFQPFPPASFAYDKSVERKGRDVEKARALLKEAGLDRVKVEISFGNNTIMQQVFELIQAMGSEAGFDISLRSMEFAALQSTMARGDFELAQAGWSGRVDPSGNVFQYVSCKGSLNDGRFCDETMDKLLNDAREELDVEKRKVLYREFLNQMRAKHPIFYTYYLPWTFGVQKRVQGFVPYPDGLVRLKDVTLAGQ